MWQLLPGTWQEPAPLPSRLPRPFRRMQAAAGDALAFALLAPFHLATDIVVQGLGAVIVLFWRVPVAFAFGLACKLAWKPLPGLGSSWRELIQFNSHSAVARPSGQSAPPPPSYTALKHGGMCRLWVAGFPGPLRAGIPRAVPSRMQYRPLPLPSLAQPGICLQIRRPSAQPSAASCWHGRPGS